jgi:type IV pilus assembly protein PilW
MKHPRRHPTPLRAARRTAHGFTLIEILVALALGVLILLALTILFARNSGNQSELERNTRQLESARYAIDLLAEDVMHAGYFGEFDPNGLTDAAPPTAVWTNKNPPNPPHPDPCAVAVNAQGWDTTVVPAQIPVSVQGIGAATALGCLANRMAGTEALVVRRAETGAPLTLAAATNNNLYIQISLCDADPAPRISAANGGSASFNLHFPPPAGATGCGAVNDSLRRLSQRTYFVASCNDCVANDGIPTLKRVEMINGALRTMSVAEGIENLQIEYGIDTDTDGVPNNFVTTAGVTEVAPNLWENVVSVRLHLLTRSTQPTPGFSDTRTYQLGPDVAVTPPPDGNKRTLMTSTVRLHNVGGRRE